MTTVHWERKVDLMKRREGELLKKMVEMERKSAALPPPSRAEAAALSLPPSSPKSPPRVKATRRRRRKENENDTTPQSAVSSSSAWSLDESEIEREMSSRRLENERQPKLSAGRLRHLENEEVSPAKKGKRRRRNKTNRAAQGIYQHNVMKIRERRGRGERGRRREHSNNEVHVDVPSSETVSVRSLSKRLQTTAEMSREIRQKGSFERAVALDM